MVIRRCSAPFGKNQQCNNNRITFKMFITSPWQMSIIILHKQLLWINLETVNFSDKFQWHWFSSPRSCHIQWYLLNTLCNTLCILNYVAGFFLGLPGFTFIHIFLPWFHYKFLVEELMFKARKPFFFCAVFVLWEHGWQRALSSQSLMVTAQCSLDLCRLQ